MGAAAVIFHVQTDQTEGCRSANAVTATEGQHLGGSTLNKERLQSKLLLFKRGAETERVKKKEITLVALDKVINLHPGFAP